MSSNFRALLGAASLLALSAPLAAQTSGASMNAAVQPGPIVYPATERGTTVETQFGEQIADPYRWLENDVRTDPKVAEWVAAQNAVTDAYLDTLPGRDWFKGKIAALMNYERFGVPQKYGSRYFYTRNTGLQNQSPLYVQDGLNGERRVLLDPNTWA